MAATTTNNRQNSAGALVGFNRGIVRESGLSYIWGDICKISGRNVSGGLVGGNEGIVERSWSNCDDINSKKAGGGLVGFNHPGGIVRDSWADGLVIVKRKGWKKGALIGRNFGTVERSFSLGQTRRDKTYHGPLTGQQGGVVTDSYFVGHGYDEKYGGEHLKDEDMRTPRASHPRVLRGLGSPAVAPGGSQHLLSVGGGRPTTTESRRHGRWDRSGRLIR